MADDETGATTSRLLQLNEERGVMQEGFRFLDEKLLLLAAETLRELKRYEQLRGNYLDAHEDAALALMEAVERHGLELLQTVAAPMGGARLDVSRHSFLGVPLQEADLNLREEEASRTPEAERCAVAFRHLTKQGAALAALTGNLERLLVEYRRTARRARALEDVILPELEAAISDVGTHLEEADQEEAVRTHYHRTEQ
jgi:V/A-type H+-transporting ATPase subunit D